MRVLQKAVACVVRRRSARAELLAFQHPTAGVQLPKGGIEPHEAPATAVLRELLEESGISAAVVRAKVAELSHFIGGGSDETGDITEHVWHVFWLEPTDQLPSVWEHQAEGSAEESGLTFSYRWLPLESAKATLHPRFHSTIDALLGSLRSTYPMSEAPGSAV